MENKRLSRFNYRAWTAGAVTAAFFVPLMVFGAPALAGSAASQYEYSGSSQYQYKVTLCHHTHSKKHPWVTIRVGAPAAKAHLRHHDGDYLGACTTPPAPAAPAPKKNGNDQHGNSGDHGKSGDHGNSGTNGHGKGK
jgi:hypothetical protein